MSLPKPIRYDRDTWLCMRNDPTLPKAIIRRVMLTENATGRKVEAYRVVTWAVESADRELVGYYRDLSEANRAVLYDVRQVGQPGPINGR